MIEVIDCQVCWIHRTRPLPATAFARAPGSGLEATGKGKLLPICEKCIEKQKPSVKFIPFLEGYGEWCVQESMTK